MEIFIFWFGGAIAVGAFADIRRNRSGFGWFILALLISPLLAFIFAAIMRPRALLPSLSSERMIAGMSASGTGVTVKPDPDDSIKPLIVGLIFVAFFALAVIVSLHG